MPSSQRYKFIGSNIYVGTGRAGISPSPSITGISQSDPTVISTAPQPHGLVQGDVAYIYGIVGATQFNDKSYPIGNVTTDSAQLGGEDNTLGAAWVSGGKVDEWVFTQWCELTGVNQQDGGTDQEEVSTICSTAKEFEPGLPDTGEATFDFNFAPLTAVQAFIKASKEAGSTIPIKIVLPNSGGTIIMLGNVQATSFNAQIGQAVYRGSASIKLSGPLYIF